MASGIFRQHKAKAALESYGIDTSIFFGVPVVCNGGQIERVAGMDINAFVREKLQRAEDELRQERAAVGHLLH